MSNATLFILVNNRCKSYEYRNCDCKNSENSQNSKCNLGGVYSPRQWKETLNEAKEYCEQHSDCKGITNDNNGYEPGKGPGVGMHFAAHELWLCRGIKYRQ